MHMYWTSAESMATKFLFWNNHHNIVDFSDSISSICWGHFHLGMLTLFSFCGATLGLSHLQRPQGQNLMKIFEKSSSVDWWTDNFWGQVIRFWWMATLSVCRCGNCHLEMWHRYIWCLWHTPALLIRLLQANQLSTRWPVSGVFVCVSDDGLNIPFASSAVAWRQLSMVVLKLGFVIYFDSRLLLLVLNGFHSYVSIASNFWPL